MLCPYVKCILIVNMYWIICIKAQYREEINDSGITVVALKQLDDNISAENNYKLMNNKYSNYQNNKEKVQSEEILDNDLNDLDSKKLKGFFNENAHELPQNTRRYINNLLSNDGSKLERIKDFERMTDTNVTESPESPIVAVEETEGIKPTKNVTDTNEQDVVLHKILEVIKQAHFKFTSEIANKSSTTTDRYHKPIIENSILHITTPPSSIDKTSDIPRKALIELIIKHEYPNSNQPQIEHNLKPHLNNYKYPHYGPSLPPIPLKYIPQNQFPFGYQDPIKHLLNVPKLIHNPYHSYTQPQNFRPQNITPQNFGPQNIGPQNFGPQNFGPQNFGPQNFYPRSFKIDEPQNSRYLRTNNIDFIIKDVPIDN